MEPGPVSGGGSELKPLDAIWHPSPNFGPRREGQRPSLVVLHYTAMQSASAALERLCDPVAEVSAHYLIGGDGTLWQMVDERDRAWHAGAGSWQGLGDVNSRSIGIELDNRGDHPFSEPQMAALDRLMRGVMARWDIAPVGVIGHSDMAPTRKCDPGGRFDWARLARAGMSLWYDDLPVADAGGAEFCDLAQRFGYPVDAPEEEVLCAFRARFRPGVHGALEAEDVRILTALLRLQIDGADLST